MFMYNEVIYNQNYPPNIPPNTVLKLWSQQDRANSAIRLRWCNQLRHNGIQQDLGMDASSHQIVSAQEGVTVTRKAVIRNCYR